MDNRSTCEWDIRSRSFFIRPTKAGNSISEDPPEERKKPGHGAEDGKHERDTDLGKRVNKTESDSGTGRKNARSAVANSGPSHRHGSDAGSVRADAQRRRAGSGRGNGGGVRARTGDEPRERDRSVQERHVLGASGETSVHPQSRWRKTSARDTDVRGQSAAKGSNDGSRSGLRAGLSAGLVRLSAEDRSAARVARPASGTDGDGRGLGAGSGHSIVLRAAWSMVTCAAFWTRGCETE